MCLLVAGREIHPHRRPGRPRIHLVSLGAPTRRALLGPSLLGDSGSLRPLALRRAQLSIRERGRGLQASALGFQRRHAPSSKSGSYQLPPTRERNCLAHHCRLRCVSVAAFLPTYLPAGFGRRVRPRCACAPTRVLRAIVCRMKSRLNMRSSRERGRRSCRL